MSRIIPPERFFTEHPLCYACEAPKTSMEHAPARCFFPEEKDEKGNYLFRTDLIKVPSCDEHNSQKSGDDIYAAFHLAEADGTNRCAEMVRNTILQRMADRDWGERSGKFMRRIRDEICEIDAGRPVGNLDARRMIRVARDCARAVYFYDKYRKLKLPLRVASIGNDFRDSEKTKRLRELESFFDSEMVGCLDRGANPEVFQYAICEKPDQSIVLIRLTFYATLKQWVYYHPSAAPNIV